ncbi:uncharacterized protein LOC110456650, partial [Mizuhopecten yessoensis]|uniref:uncharacterized protein LOC110456650 n=1 Tax=Mizuhopecten yessoensis TaxID=6573 RepID=UPI000B45DEFA
MEVLAEPQDIKLNRSSTQVTFNTGFKEINGGSSDEDSNAEKRIEPNRNNLDMEVIAKPADIRFNRSSTQVTFNTGFKKINGGSSDEDSNAEKRIEPNQKRHSIPDMEVIAEPADIRLNRSSTQVEFNTGFEDTQAETSYEDSFTEELLEPDEVEPLEILPDNDTDDSNLSYGDDFHTSSDSDVTDTSEESGPERYPMIEENLDNGIFVRFPENHKFKVPYICRYLQLHTRTTQLAELREALAGSKLITDMFGVYLKSTSEEEDNLVSLPFVDNCAGEIRISVAVKAKRSPHFKYSAHLRRNGDWVKVPVQMKGDIAECEGGAFDILFLASEPIIERFILGPEGKEFISEQDNKIKLSFPRNCVRETEILHVQIIPSSNDGPICMDDQPCIIGATKSILVQHRKGIFKKSIEMNLELCLFDDSTDPDLTKYNFVDVHAVNKQEENITMRKLPLQSYTQNGNDFSLCIKVDDFE